jgi:alpha-glucosidase
MLHLYRALLRIRREDEGLLGDAFAWLPSEPGVLAFARGARFASVTNLSGRAVDLPAHDAVLLASADVGDGSLPPDATAWLRTAPADDSTREGAA